MSKKLILGTSLIYTITIATSGVQCGLDFFKFDKIILKGVIYYGLLFRVR